MSLPSPDAMGIPMKQISNPGSFGYKIFPYAFCGGLAVMAILLLTHGALRTDPMSVVVPCVMAVIGFISWKSTMQNLADAVYDAGDFLLVRKDGQEETIPFSHIINVNFAANRSGARITLSLDPPGKFGPEVMFVPPARFYWSAFPKNEIAEDLVARSEAARLKKSA